MVAPFMRQMLTSPLLLRHMMSVFPSPLKSPVAATVQLVGITPKSALDAMTPPFMNQMFTSPLELRQRMSVLPSPLKSPVPMMDQLAGIVPRSAAELIVPLFMNQATTSPLVLRQRMSDLASSLKSGANTVEAYLIDTVTGAEGMPLAMTTSLLGPGSMLRGALKLVEVATPGATLLVL